MSQVSPSRFIRVHQRVQQLQEVMLLLKGWQQPADAVLAQWMKNQSALGGRDRAELSDAVFALLRHWRLFEQLTHSAGEQQPRQMALLALAELHGIEAVSQELEAEDQAWLKQTLAVDTANLPFAQRFSLPDWLAEELQKQAEPEALAAALNVEAGVDIRVNPMRADRKKMLATLQAGERAAFNPEAMRYSPWGIRLEGRPTLRHWPEFEKGELEVQDEGSQILAALVAPRRNELIIDFCAGAGGKSLLLGALMRGTGKLYAMDVSAARLERAKPRFARCGLDNVNSMAIAENDDKRLQRFYGKAQRVLVDAPCSGLGTLRRNPDLKWRLRAEEISQYVELQQVILQRAAKCVAPGGRLVYATCSVLPEENEQQIQTFLQACPDFQVVPVNEVLKARIPDLLMQGDYLSLRPDLHGTDGFFAAVLVRTAVTS
ncbi:RsmB/NOP family class I SAM-dependent RNA methyltransferase [Paenalcaligenes suwonensis]|uniref:RsmB/NOP family class I SAM-dependent RNA methyltransferase n=1 Tax=Paenalcaligenes suwonensis TaxID=1202713 RepID=UPI00140A8318|nr:RsmB/NOP family class I SAM-dependent RNA methyltransferase [Paenalcaligenes suwonensis]NHC61083.1 RsmB/NOP family class I SAM-dependent RNA methyltransferase [Paenalcaligenes suwonensis]